MNQCPLKEALTSFSPHSIVESYKYADFTEHMERPFGAEIHNYSDKIDFSTIGFYLDDADFTAILDVTVDPDRNFYVFANLYRVTSGKYMLGERLSKIWGQFCQYIDAVYETQQQFFGFVSSLHYRVLVHIESSEIIFDLSRRKLVRQDLFSRTPVKANGKISSYVVFKEPPQRGDIAHLLHYYNSTGLGSAIFHRGITRELLFSPGAKRTGAEFGTRFVNYVVQQILQTELFYSEHLESFAVNPRRDIDAFLDQIEKPGNPLYEIRHAIASATDKYMLKHGAEPQNDKVETAVATPTVKNLFDFAYVPSFNPSEPAQRESLSVDTTKVSHQDTLKRLEHVRSVLSATVQLGVLRLSVAGDPDKIQKKQIAEVFQWPVDCLILTVTCKNPDGTYAYLLM